MTNIGELFTWYM